MDLLLKHYKYIEDGSGPSLKLMEDPEELRSIKGVIKGKNRDQKSQEDMEGETPLFLAALHGHKEAFLYLHSICVEEGTTTTELHRPWRRENGDTILHVTIHKEYFGKNLHFQLTSPTQLIDSWIS